MTRRSLLVLLLLLASAMARAAETGSIKGTVMLERTPPSPLADAVVMVDGPPTPAAPPARHAVVDQRNQTFVPHVIAIAVGTTVDFPNHDPTLHNVFSASSAKKFDLGMYGEGDTRSVTFDAPGIVHIGCNAHPKMEAFVVVHPNPHAAVTDARGAYTIEGIAPGSYDVRIWHDGLPEQKVPVVVRAGNVQPLDVRVVPPR